jgi:hypothetical protein
MTRRAPLIWVNAGSQKKKRGEHFAGRAVVAMQMVLSLERVPRLPQ